MIAMMVQFLEHPVTVDALLPSVMKDVDLPKSDEKLAHNRVAHARNHSIKSFDDRWRCRVRVPSATRTESRLAIGKARHHKRHIVLERAGAPPIAQSPQHQVGKCCRILVPL